MTILENVKLAGWQGFGPVHQTTLTLNSDGDHEIPDVGSVEFIITGYQNEPEYTRAKIFKALPVASSAGNSLKRLVSCGREAGAGRGHK